MQTWSWKLLKVVQVQAFPVPRHRQRRWLRILRTWKQLWSRLNAVQGCSLYLLQGCSLYLHPLGNQTWQWKVPYKWRFEWINQLWMVDFRLPLFWSILTNIYLFGGCSDYKVCLKIGDASKLRFRTMDWASDRGEHDNLQHVMEWGSNGFQILWDNPIQIIQSDRKSLHDSIPSGSVEDDEVKASSRGCTNYLKKHAHIDPYSIWYNRH